MSLFFSFLETFELWFCSLMDGGCACVGTRLSGRVEVAMDTETMTRAELQSALELHGLDSRGTKAQMKVCNPSQWKCAHSCFKRNVLFCDVSRRGWNNILSGKIRRKGSLHHLKQHEDDKEGKKKRKRLRVQRQSGCNGD